MTPKEVHAVRDGLRALLATLTRTTCDPARDVHVWSAWPPCRVCQCGQRRDDEDEEKGGAP